MAISNKERVGRGLDLLRAGLVPFAEREFRAKLGGYWADDLVSRLGLRKESDGAIAWDTHGILKAIGDSWMSVFKYTLGHVERSFVGELRDVRNNWAHDRPFTSDYTYRALDTMQRLLQSVTAASEADAVGELKADLQRQVYEEQARNKTRYQLNLEGTPKKGLKPWREIVTPHPDVASGRYMQAEFAADLHFVYKGQGSVEYRDPEEFFRRTYITSGLRELLVGALQRMSGKGGDPVVELQTNFGGGKTHSMLALYHLFGETPTSELEGIEPVLKEAGIEAAPEAHRAVLVGTHMSPGEISDKPDGTQVRTMWGELAWQLGNSVGNGAKAYKIVEESDQKGVSPGAEVLVELFKQYSPCLVLIDEWVAYARQVVGKRDLPSGDFEAQSTFAQAITEAAKGAPGTLIVASIPASKIEIGGENGEFALESLKNIFVRVGKPWRPATGDEGFEIIRRRLFEPIADKDSFAYRDAVVNAFTKMYRDSASDFPSECSEGKYKEEILSAYPIHPELFRRLYDDWSTLDKFQRTRGVLRLLAKIIHRLWENQDGSLLIMPASVPMDDGTIKSEFTRYLDDVWEPIISQDVDGPNSLPLDLDREFHSQLGRYSACRRVARSIYVGTAPGSRDSNPGIGDQRIRLACAQPGEPSVVFGDALRRISDKAKYIHQDGNRYWLSTKPNLNRMAEDRAAALLGEPEELHAEIVRRISKKAGRGDFAGVHCCPEATSDVPDDPTARLVVLRPDAAHRRNKLDSDAMSVAREYLDYRGKSPRLNRNCLVFMAADKKELDALLDATAQYLAWKSIWDERTPLNLDVFQSNQAETRTTEGDQTVDLRITGTWIHLLVPRQDSATEDVVWEVLKAGGNDNIAKRASIKLAYEEALFAQMGGVRLRMALDKYLWQDKDHVSLGELSEWFARYLYLPRVCSRQTLIDAIQDGASTLSPHDTFATAAGFDQGSNRYQDLRLGRAPGPIDTATLVVKPSSAEPQWSKEQNLSSGPSEQPDIDGEPTQSGSAEGTPPSTTPAASKPRFFVGAVRLNPLRIGKDAGRINEEVVQHLSTLPGAEVEVSLEIQIRIPEGVEDDLAQTISENCNTLKFSSHSFEKE